MAADATLVKAAFDLGKSRVPGDFSAIFNKQYEGLIAFNNQRAQGMADITKAAGGLAIDLTKAGVEIAQKNKEFNAEYKSMTDDYTSALNAESADIYKNGSSQNQSVVDHAHGVIDDYKAQITELQAGGDPNKKTKKEIMGLYGDLEKFRGKLNEERANVLIANELYETDEVDLANSYGGDPNLQAVAAIQRSPKGDQKAMGISYFRNEDNDLVMRYPTNILNFAYLEGVRKDQMQAAGGDPDLSAKLYQPDEKISLEEDSKYAVSGEDSPDLDKSTQSTLPQAEYETITVKALNSMLVKKDRASNNAANGVVEEAALASKAQDKSTKKLMHGDFSRIKVQTYDKFYDIFKSKDANIQYLATNPLTIGYGSSKRTYKQDLAMNQDINVAVIETLGIGSDEFTAEELKDGKISPAELAKHDEAKAMIIEKLTNPQTESDRLIAAGELAKYWTQHAEAEFNYSRTPPDKVVNKKKIDYQSMVEEKKVQKEDGFSDDISDDNNTLINTDGFAQGSDLA